MIHYPGYTSPGSKLSSLNSRLWTLNSRLFTNPVLPPAPPAFIDIGHKARVSSPRCGTWVGSRASFLAPPRDSEDNPGVTCWELSRDLIGGSTMFSDNENPGADISAGQTATAAAAAQEQTTNVEVDQAMPVAVEAQSPLLGAEPAP